MIVEIETNDFIQPDGRPMAVIRNIARSAHSGECLDSLSKLPNWNWRCEIACNNNVLPETLVFLAHEAMFFYPFKNEGEELPRSCLRNIAANVNSPEILLDRIEKAEIGSLDLICLDALASNKNATPERLERLSVCKNYLVKEAVASNLNTKPEILEKLANDSNYLVRKAVAKNPNIAYIDRKIVEHLSKDDRIEVKAGLLVNPSIKSTDPIIKELIKCRAVFDYWKAGSILYDYSEETIARCGEIFDLADILCPGWQDSGDIFRPNYRYRYR